MLARRAELVVWLVGWGLEDGFLSSGAPIRIDLIASLPCHDARDKTVTPA